MAHLEKYKALGDINFEFFFIFFINMYYTDNIIKAIFLSKILIIETARYCIELNLTRGNKDGEITVE